MRNPVNYNLFAGGSSGGTAAAIAAGFCKIGLGTDTNGSCRIPASLCGIYGYRPTINRYPLEGVVPLSHTRDTIGLLADNLDDIELFDSILTSGEGRVSPGCYGTLHEKIRLGVSKYYFYMSISKEVAAATEEVLQKIKDKNTVELVNVDMIGIERLIPKGMAIVEHELNIDLPKFLEDNNVGISYDEIIEGIASPDVKRLFETCKEKFDSGNTSEKYETDLQGMEKLTDFYETFFHKHKLDGLIYPTLPVEAKPIEENMDSLMMDGRYVNTGKTLVQNTDPGSIAGVPSITLPLAKTSNGLPVGIQIETLQSHDRLQFEIAAAVRDSVFENDDVNGTNNADDDAFLANDDSLV